MAPAPTVAAAASPPRRSPSSAKSTSRSTRIVNASLIAKSVTPLPLSKDPTALLDSLDQQHAQRQQQQQQQQQQSSDGSASAPSTAPQFDPIDFLNQHYETEQSLSQQLPALRESVNRRMQVLNDRISFALQRQSETAESTQRHVASAKASTVELQNRILLIQEKAAASEKAVLDITKDMKRLDCAKQSLSRTITTLKRLHMLVHAVEQLRQTATCCSRETTATTAAAATAASTAEPPDYKTASHLVDAVSQLFQHFDAYTAKVQPMRILSNKVNDYKEDLRHSVTTAFRVVAFGPGKTRQLQGLPELDDSERPGSVLAANNASSKMTPETMKGGVLLVDALDGTQKFIHDFCQDYLGDYLKEFEPPSRVVKQPEKRVSSFKKVVDENPEPANAKAGLDQIEQRYTWFLQGPLQEIQKHFPGVFPPRWNLQASLAHMFLQLTRDHILALLDGPRRDPAASDATILLKALQKTIVFEKDITGWLERECGAVFESTVSSDNDSASQRNPNAGVQDGTAPPVPLNSLIGVASVAFQSYMGPYIKLEEQSMDEQLVEALEDRTVDTRGERPVFISSTNLFVYIKGSITRCTALTKGNAFFLLYRAFKDSLKKYAQILNGKLPPPITEKGPNVGSIVIAPFGGHNSKQDSAAGTSASYRIPTGEEVTVCHVISTCEYCADTMEALEDLIRDTIEEEHKHKIDMISDQEQFHDITAKSIRVLVSGLTNRLEGSFKTLTMTNWAVCDAVGDESMYVLSIHDDVEPFVRQVRNLLPTSYFRSFCDKFALAFTATFYDNLIRLKRISEPGTQQLLLDLNNLKTLFLKLPVLEDLAVPGSHNKKAPGASIAPAMYTKMVQKQFGRMETILKLVGTPNDLLIENFKVQWPGGTTSDMQIVMNLKGMKRGEQVSMFEKFGHDPVSALKGATAGVTSAAIVSERVQQLQDQGSNVAAKVNSDLNQMRQKVDDFRKTWK